MCAVSVIIDMAKQAFPSVSNWPQPVVTDMTEVIRLLRSIDEKLGSKDCIDAKKDEFLKQLNDRLTVLEKSDV